MLNKFELADFYHFPLGWTQTGSSLILAFFESEARILVGLLIAQIVESVDYRFSSTWQPKGEIAERSYKTRVWGLILQSKFPFEEDVSYFTFHKVVWPQFARLVDSVVFWLYRRVLLRPVDTLWTYWNVLDTFVTRNYSAILTVQCIGLQ